MADPEASQDYTSDTVGVLDAQTSLGQTFISRRPNLNGITLWVSSSPASANGNSAAQTINVKLFHSLQDSAPVFSTSINAPVSGNNIPVTVSIPDLENPAGQAYYLLLSTAAGSIQINGRNEDAYPHGQAYVNGNGIAADIAFRLSYNYDLASLLQDLSQFAAESWLIIPLLILLWLPGWLLLEFAGIRSPFDLGERIALSTGLSLALIPVVMLWTSILHLKWSGEAVIFTAGFLIALLVVRVIYRYVITRRNRQKPSPNYIE